MIHTSSQWTDAPVKLIQLTVGQLGLQDPLDARQVRVGGVLGRGRQTRPDLQVGFAVQVGRLHVAHPVRLRRGQQHKVRGEKFVL